MENQLVFEKIIDMNGRIVYDVKHVRLIWTNFGGHEGRYNPEGQRNFNIVIPEDVAQQLQDDGFNVKFHPAKNPDDDGIWTLKIKVNMKGTYPPAVAVKNNHGYRKLDAESIGILDNAIILDTELKFVPYRHEEFTTAYLRELIAMLYESPMDNAYENEEDSATNTMTFAKVSKTSESED